MVARASVMSVEIQFAVCKCKEFGGVPHGYLFVGTDLTAQPASFSLQCSLNQLSLLVEWAGEREVLFSPDVELIFHKIVHADLPRESLKDNQVFAALREGGCSSDEFVCKWAKETAFELHKAALRRMS